MSGRPSCLHLHIFFALAIVLAGPFACVGHRLTLGTRHRHSDGSSDGVRSESVVSAAVGTNSTFFVSFFGTHGSDRTFEQRYAFASWKGGCYVVGLCCFCCLLAWLYRKRGAWTVCSILLYILAVSWMSCSIKHIFLTFGFAYPRFVTATHLLLTSVISFSWILLQMSRTKGEQVSMPSLKQYFTGVLPQAALVALSIGCDNLGLVYTNVHFYEMLNSTSLLVTAGLGMLLGRGLKSQLLLPVCFISIASLVVSVGEVRVSIAGAFLVISGIIFRALRVQMQGLLLIGCSAFEKMRPVELVAWSSVTCFFFMTAWSLVCEGMEPWTHLANHGSRGLYLSMCASAIDACVLNISILCVLAQLGPVGQQTVGQLKGALSCATAVVTLDEALSPHFVLGYGVIVIAIAWYNHIDQTSEEDVVAIEKKPFDSHLDAMLSFGKRWCIQT